MTDDELEMVLQHLGDIHQREDEKITRFCEDPMTVHYGIASEMMPIVGKKAKEVELWAEALWLEQDERARRRGERIAR